MSVFHRFKSLSLKNIFGAIWAMVKRFPLVVLSTVLGTGIQLYITEDIKGRGDFIETAWKILLVLMLGVPLFLSLNLLSERFGWKKIVAWLLQLGGVAFLFAYYFFLPGGPDDFNTQQMITLVLLNVIFWLLVFSVPFLKKENSIAEWKYIEVLFIRGFVTEIFAATLFAGLALSMWAVNYLFGVKWDGETYIQLWTVITGIFAAWFFFAGFPKHPQDLDQNFIFPKVLRVFVQFILVPLLCIFYVILYAYVGKILVTWNWPLGGVAIWILAFSITGVLTYLIGQPMVKHNDYPWLKKFFAIFFALILPLTIVLFMAIGIRVNEYGMTEERYLVVLFGLWLIVVALYYLFSKKKEVKFVPLFTAAVFFLSLFGPWSMFNLSVRSQYNRLEDLLIQNKILVDGKIHKVTDAKAIDPKVTTSIRSQIKFLAEHRATDKIQDWFTDDLKKVDGYNESKEHPVRSYTIVDNAMKEMGLTDVYKPTDSQYFSYSSESKSVIQVGSYEYLMQDIYFSSYDMTRIKEREVDVGGRKISISLENGVLKFFEGQTLLVEKNMNEYVKELIAKYGKRTASSTSAEDLSFALESEKAKVKVYITSLSGDDKSGTIKISHVSLKALIAFR